MFKPDKLPYKKYINDYELNLIIPSEIKDVEKFKTELNLVVKALAMRNDEEGFKKLIVQKEYSSIDEKTADVICELTAMKRIKAEGGRINMCKAVEKIKEEAREEGIKKGKYNIIVKMMKNGMPDDMLIQYCGISSDELDKYKKGLLAEKTEI
jgi:predicted transposase/invertase (TIGR01784 family)